MSSKLHLLYKVFTAPKRLRTLIAFDDKGYLDETGWFNAFYNNSAIDADGNPVPWATYSFIDFITERLEKHHTIFEFGCGNSTRFYAKLANKVVSVEHNKEWLDKVTTTKPGNAEIIFCELAEDGDYCRTPVKLGETFNIIVIDGRDRVNCCKQAVKAITKDGVIVLDDAEREKYKEGVEFLKNNGFKALSFSGISPGLFYRKATSVFYRPDNCLNI